MKILQVLPALGQGGVERGAVEIAQALSAAGVPNAVASAGGRLEQALRAAGTECIGLPLASKNPWTIRANAKALARIALDGGFTLMHVRSRAPAWSVRGASRMSGVPFISTWHGLYGTSPRFLKIPYNRIMLAGCATIAVSDCVRRHIIETYGADERKIVRIHRGADTSKFRPDAATEEEAAALRARLGARAGERIVLLPARLTRWKGQELLLRAGGLMKERKTIFVFAGSDQGRNEYSAHLKKMAESLSLKAVFIDHFDDMPLLYKASDVVASASSEQPEAFGRTIPEAQATGAIAVGTAHGGACETIRDGETGFLVPPGDAAALAAALDRALSLAPDERRRISAASVESVRKNFSTRKMCAETLAFYSRLHECGFNLA